MHFDGNTFGLHLLLTRNDLNLTFNSIAAMIKYPRTCSQINNDNKKFNIFNTDFNESNHIMGSSSDGYIKRYSIQTILKKFDLLKVDIIYRHPLSFIMEFADELAYIFTDIEDALKLGIISLDDIIDENNNTLRKVYIESTGTTHKALIYSKALDQKNYALLRA